MKWRGYSVIATAILLGVLLVLMLAGMAFGQDYRLGPEDVLTVTVLRHPELSANELTITQDGNINLPMAGQISVAGKTSQAAAAEIERVLKSRLVSPEVTITVKTPRQERVFVLGTVGKPGILDMKSGWRVTEALAAVGGLTVRPELADGTILRLNKDVIPLDLAAILNQSDGAANIQMQAGDVLTLKERTVRVSVAGQVQHPGAIDLPIGAGVVEAVALAGGAASKAALTRTTIKRADGVVVPVDLFKVMMLGDVAGNIKLQAGDLVMIPESKSRIAVLGAVRTPGYFDIEDGTSPKMTDLVAMAGGPEKKARINQVALLRVENNQPKRIIVDLEKVLKQGKTSADMLVQSGDVIYVPNSKMDWDFAMRALSSVASFGWLIN